MIKIDVYRIAYGDLEAVILFLMFSVFVFACPASDIRRYMLIADQAGMGDGSYIFIQLDHQVNTSRIVCQRDIKNTYNITIFDAKLSNILLRFGEAPGVFLRNHGNGWNSPYELSCRVRR